MHEFYENPLCGRYADEEMKRQFSDDNKFSTWRRLWLALAESEQELGLNISDEQLDEMRAHIDDIDYAAAAAHEHEVRHDVMAHVLTFGECCPKAKPIIHLGATSCYVGDNTDIIRMRGGLLIIRKLLVNAVAALSEFAEKYKSLPTLAYTHFQAAQPTTVGKRACLWINDLLFDIEQLDFQLSQLKLLGCKGTTGTGASFLELFDGDAEKVEELERRIAAKMGFEACQAVSGQTYTRKVDFAVLQVLSGIAQSASKFSSDIRLLSHLKEVEKYFLNGKYEIEDTKKTEINFYNDTSLTVQPVWEGQYTCKDTGYPQSESGVPEPVTGSAVVGDSISLPERNDIKGRANNLEYSLRDGLAQMAKPMQVMKSIRLKRQICPLKVSGKRYLMI